MSFRQLFVSCDSGSWRKNMTRAQRARLGLWEVLVDENLCDDAAALCALAAYEQEIDDLLDLIGDPAPRQEAHFVVTVMDPLTGYPIVTDTAGRHVRPDHVHSIRRLHA